MNLSLAVNLCGPMYLVTVWSYWPSADDSASLGPAVLATLSWPFRVSCETGDSTIDLWSFVSIKISHLSQFRGGCQSTSAASESGQKYHSVARTCHYKSITGNEITFGAPELVKVTGSDGSDFHEDAASLDLFALAAFGPSESIVTTNHVVSWNGAGKTVVVCRRKADVNGLRLRVGDQLLHQSQQLFNLKAADYFPGIVGYQIQLSL